MQKLTRAGVGLASGGLTLLGLGMAMGNVELLVLSFIPLLLLAVGVASKPRAKFTASRNLSTRAPRRGDTFEAELRLLTAPGTDIVEVHSPVPDGFTLESGSNLALLVGAGVAASRFSLRAHARGSHELPPVRAEAIDPRGLLAPEPRDVAPAESVEVTPRAPAADRLRRRMRGQARVLLPDREAARAGVGSTDFRELREYAWGDPPKSINWKATARRLSARGGATWRAQTPLVNEYEKEGRTTVIVLLDGGQQMRVGTKLETGLDHAVEAALTAARLYLARGARVGAATFNAKSAAPAPPDAGSGQLPSLERALAPGEPDSSLTPTRVLSAFERHLAGARPAILVVTRVTPRSVPDLVELVQRLRVLAGERRRGPPVYVLDVRAAALAPTPTPGWAAARRIIELEDEAASRGLAVAGARVVPWRPDQEDVRAALVRRGIA